MSKYPRQMFVHLFIAHMYLLQVTCITVTSSLWRRTASGPVDTYQMSLYPRSPMDCVRACKEHSPCSRVAFQKSTSTCFLLPTSSADAQGDGADFYEEESEWVVSYLLLWRMQSCTSPVWVFIVSQEVTMCTDTATDYMWMINMSLSLYLCRCVLSSTYYNTMV